MGFSFGNSVLDAYSANLQGAWLLDEESGTRYDQTDNDNDLTDNNTVGYAAGKLGNAADFDISKSEYLAISDASQTGLDITGNITIFCWIKPGLIGGIRCILSKYDDNTGNYRSYYLRISNGTLIFNVSSDGSDNYNAVSTNTVSTGVWYHLFAIYDGSDVKLYVNDVEWASTPFTGSIFNSPADFILGAYSSLPKQFYDGLLDEVFIWNTALSADARAALYTCAYPDYDSLAVRRTAYPANRIPPHVLVW